MINRSEQFEVFHRKMQDIYLKPLIDKTFELMEKHGLMPERPEELDDDD